MLTQGNSESDKYRFNTASLTGSDYHRYPIDKIYVLSIVKNFCLSAYDFALMQKISITIYHSYSNSIRVGVKCVKLSIALKTHIFYLKLFNIAIVQKMLNMCKILSFHIGC